MHFIHLLPLLFTTLSLAANCDNSQPRTSDYPSGDDIAEQLRNGISTLCATTDIPGITANTWPVGSVVLLAQRKDPYSPLLSCEKCLEDIIDSCIAGGKVWGGSAFDGDEAYQIYDQSYPDFFLPNGETSSSNASSYSPLYEQGSDGSDYNPGAIKPAGASNGSGKGDGTDADGIKSDGIKYDGSK